MHGDLQKSAKDTTLEHTLFAAFNTDKCTGREGRGATVGHLVSWSLGPDGGWVVG